MNTMIGERKLQILVLNRVYYLAYHVPFALFLVAGRRLPRRNLVECHTVGYAQRPVHNIDRGPGPHTGLYVLYNRLYVLQR